MTQFFIPTIYLRKKDNTYFFQENQCKIFNLDKSCIGKVVETEFIKEIEPFKYYNFKKITNKSAYLYIVSEYYTMPAKVLIVTKQPSWLFGAIYDYSDEVKKNIKTHFNKYKLPDATPFAKVCPLPDLEEELNKHGTLLVNTIIYYATNKILYAYPCDIRKESEMDMHKVTEITKNIFSRTAFYRAKSLIKELSLIFKDLDMDFDGERIIFNKDNHNFVIFINTMQVFKDEEEICIVESDMNLCKEDRAIARALSIISGVVGGDYS